MTLAGRLLVGSCLCYQAVTLLSIILVFVYFGIIGPERLVQQLQANYSVLVTVAVPTTLTGICVFTFCYYTDIRY